MPDDLYSIDLDPNDGPGGVPNGTSPTGSIGGSDVGANERDDQRVRDLMQQYLEESTTLSFLTNQLNLLNLGGGDTLIAEYYNSDNVQLFRSIGASGDINATMTGTTRTITLPGGPVRLILGANWDVSFEPFNAGLPSNGSVDCILYLYIDGVLICSATVSQGMWFDAANQRMTFLANMRQDILLEPGKDLTTRDAGFTTAAELTTALTAGDHTFRVDISAAWSDDEGIQIDCQGEYIAFYDADATKITSLQVFDATTPL